MNNKQLTRSRTNRVFLGIIGGIAEYMGIDASILRILYVVLLWSGFPVVLYFLLALIIPEAKRDTYHSYDNQVNRPRKTARKVEEEDDWSDF